MESSMRLHENEKLFKQSIRFAAQHKGIKDVYVEKDYWVTFALHTIFQSSASEFSVFKGGTALSKCYGFIERFSEDIDLVVLNQGEPGNQLKERLRMLSKTIEPTLPEIEIKEITNKLGMIRKTAHSYPKLFKGDYGQVRDFLVLESTWLGYHEPFTQEKISSFVYQMMLETGQEEITKDYDLIPFEVRVLKPIRTICEKIMSLVRFSHSESPIEDLKLKVRHLYDLNQLLAQEEYAAFLESPAFEEMLVKVAWDDTKSFKNNNKWLENHPLQALLFSDPENAWQELKKVYSNSFKDLVFGTLPPESDILATLKRIARRLKTITWDIKVDKPNT